MFSDQIAGLKTILNMGKTHDDIVETHDDIVETHDDIVETHDDIVETHGRASLQKCSTM